MTASKETGLVRVRLMFTGRSGNAAGKHSDHAASLYRWLVLDPDLRGHAKVSTAPAAPEAGHMGGALDTVNIVLGNTIALGNLLVAVAAWRGSRRNPPEVRLERDGVAVTVRDASPEDVERILRILDSGERGGDSEPHRDNGE
jgi:phage-related tail protein